MELKEFISETILQIASGIIDAKEKCKGIDVIVNPDVTMGQNSDVWIPINKNAFKIERRVQQIDMDICITVSESESKAVGAKLGISVLGFGVNSAGTSGNKNESRVRFSIPVSLPVSYMKKE